MLLFKHIFYTCGLFFLNLYSQWLTFLDRAYFSLNILLILSLINPIWSIVCTKLPPYGKLDIVFSYYPAIIQRFDAHFNVQCITYIWRFRYQTEFISIRYYQRTIKVVLINRTLLKAANDCLSWPTDCWVKDNHVTASE